MESGCAIQSPPGQHSKTGQAPPARPEDPCQHGSDQNNEGHESERHNPSQSPPSQPQDTAPNPDTPDPVRSAWRPALPVSLPASAEFPCGPRGLHQGRKNPPAWWRRNPGSRPNHTTETDSANADKQTPVSD